MEGVEFRRHVEASSSGALDRIDSPTLIVALADGEPEPEPILQAGADSEYAATTTFDGWTGDERVAEAGSFWSDLAEQERNHYERVLAALGETHEPADGGPLHAYLRSLDEPVTCLGGFVGRSLVSLRAHRRIVAHFDETGERDLAALFRGLEAETEDALERGLERLADVCTTVEEWKRAQASAEYAIQLAGDDVADAHASNDVADARDRR